MKATIALSTLASLALVSAYEVAPVEKMSLRDALCKNQPINLDLNQCFANYLGTLNYVQDGGFGSSCDECYVDDSDDTKYNLVCQCDTGADSTMNTTYALGDWKTIRIQGCLGCQACSKECNLAIGCHNSDYIEKRAEDKIALPFLA
ncbi:hypothetical protein F5B18DRAFT_655590 [Nemania serpens]|nr:hypothetical protein F5B18DRAFT_655590 [Nemania serpens]